MEKNLGTIDDDLEIIDLLRKLVRSKELLWSWQASATSKDKRKVQFSKLRKVDPIKKILIAEPTNAEGFRFELGQEIFLYSPTLKVAGKIKIREIEKEFIILPIPTQLSLLSEELVSQITIIEKEDEKSHVHLRQAPRMKANQGQVASVSKLDEQDNPIIQVDFELYDLSSGGMALMVKDPGEFVTGDKICLQMVDGKPLKTPLFGEVVSIKEIEGKLFKVGIRFKT